MHYKPKSNFTKPPKNSLPKHGKNENFNNKQKKADIVNENTAHNPSRKEPSHTEHNTDKK